MSRRQISPAATIITMMLIPLAVPAVFVFLVPPADQVCAQESAPKQALVPPPRTSEAPANKGAQARRVANSRVFIKDTATAPPPPLRSSEKTAFAPVSQAPRSNRPKPAARPVAVVGHQVQAPLTKTPVHEVQAPPTKTPVAERTSQAAPRLNAPDIFAPVVSTPPALETFEEPRFVVVSESEPEPISETEPLTVSELEQTSEPAPRHIAKNKESRTATRMPADAPHADFESLRKPLTQLNEPKEPSQPEFEMPAVTASQQPSHKFEDDAIFDEPEVVDDGMPEMRRTREVAELEFFEEPAAKGDTAEVQPPVELKTIEVQELAESQKTVEPPPETFVESTQISEIQSISAQEKTAEPEATPATVAQTEETPAPSNEVLAELKPIGSVEIRKAVEVPELAAMDNQDLREPADQARTILRQRPPFKFWPYYRDPWSGHRDSYAFHHNPLWFEDPNLERCGRGHGHLTSVMSFVQFNANIAILPYRMTAQPSCSCVRTLSDCTFCEKFGYDAYLPPWSWRAAAVQAAAVTGLIYVIP